MPATTVGWSDSLVHIDPLGRGVSDLGDNPLQTEASAEDEVSSDLLLEPPEPAPRFTFSGCELGLSGSLDPEAWARDLWYGAPWPRIVENGHTDRDGQFRAYEQIGRRWDRPEDYSLYRYPVVDAPVVSGYDLEKPDAEQRRGHMHAVGHGGVDLMAPMGTPITTVRLDHQLGDAEVLFVGSLYGHTVITRHRIRENGRDRDYVLIFGHLDRVADGVRRGASGCARERRSASWATATRRSSCICTSKRAVFATA
jgi:hypothetical protein